MNEYEKLRNLNKFKKWKFKEGLEKFSYRNVMLNYTGSGILENKPFPVPEFAIKAIDNSILISLNEEPLIQI